MQMRLMLVVVADVHARTEANRAAVRLFFADDALEQRRFAHAVIADERHAVARAQVHLHMLKERAPTEPLREVVNHQHVVARSAANIEVEVNRAFILRFLQAFDFLQPLLPAFRQTDGLLAVELPIARDNGFLPGDFLLLQLIRLHANLEPLRALHHVGGIIAVIALRRAKEQLAHAVANVIHEIAVMADEQHRAAVGAQIILQPRDGLEVKVVRWLVQQQHIRLSQQHPPKAKARPFAAGEQRSHLSLLLLAEAQTRQHALHRRAPAIAVAFLKAAGKLVVLAAEAMEGCFIVRIRHLMLQVAQLLFHALHWLKDAFQLFQHCPPFANLPLLGEVTELQPLLHGHRAAVRGFNAGNNLHEGGFSAAIDADKPHALTILQHEGCVAEDFICTETFLNALQGEQNHRKSPPGGGIIRAHQREVGSPDGVFSS